MEKKEKKEKKDKKEKKEKKEKKDIIELSTIGMSEPSIISGSVVLTYIPGGFNHHFTPGNHIRRVTAVANLLVRRAMSPPQMQPQSLDIPRRFRSVPYLRCWKRQR